VLDELFGVGMRQVPASETARREPGDPRLARVLEAAERLSSIGTIAEAANLSSAETRAALGRLEAEGYLVRRDLGGWERTLGGGEPPPVEEHPGFPGEADAVSGDGSAPGKGERMLEA
jgi:DNA-binding transcriptional MocR family regulator